MTWDLIINPIFNILSVIIGASIVPIINSIQESKKNKNKKYYDSLKIICVLDKFIESCLAVAKDDGTFFGEREEALTIQVKAPKINISDLNTDLTLLPKDISYRLFLFPEEIQETESYLDETYDLGEGGPDYTDFFFARRYRYAKHGLAAASIASQLRSDPDVKIPERQYSFDDPKEHLRHEMEIIKEKIRNSRFPHILNY